MKQPLLAALILVEGIGCTPKYSCKGYPDKTACLSATEAYQATDRSPEGTGTKTQTSNEGSVEAPKQSTPMDVRRSESRLLRIWSAPYETQEGDLEGARYTVADIEPRHWEIKGTRVNPLKTWPPLSAAPPASVTAPATPHTEVEEEDLEP